jgi:hypothetical protein
MGPPKPPPPSTGRTPGQHESPQPAANSQILRILFYDRMRRIEESDDQLRSCFALRPDEVIECESEHPGDGGQHRGAPAALAGFNLG